MSKRNIICEMAGKELFIYLAQFGFSRNKRIPCARMETIRFFKQEILKSRNKREKLPKIIN